jgi:acyl carrier protein
MRDITDSTTLKRKLKGIVSNLLDIDISKIKETDSIEEFGANSIDLINLIAALEEEFGIEIEDEDIEYLITVNDVAAYLERRLKLNFAR